MKMTIRSLPRLLQIVEALYEGFRRRDLPAILGLPPRGGRYYGHEGARRFFGLLGSHINSTQAIGTLIDSGDQIMATDWTEGTVNASGAAYDSSLVANPTWQDSRGQFIIDHPGMLKALESGCRIKSTDPRYRRLTPHRGARGIASTNLRVNSCFGA